MMKGHDNGHSKKMSVVISSIVGPCVVIVGELFRYPCNHSRFLLSDCNLFSHLWRMGQKWYN